MMLNACFIRSIAALLLLGAVSVANATDYTIPNPLESYEDGYTSSVVVFPKALSGTSFDDSWLFSIGSGGDLSTSVGYSNLTLKGIKTNFVENFKMYLYKDGFLLFDGQESITDAPLLSSGDYSINVTGDITGSKGGSYYLTAIFSPSPVPEPGTWMMLAAGLALIGFRLKQRNT